jgi:hypothetical protein
MRHRKRGTATARSSPFFPSPRSGRGRTPTTNEPGRPSGIASALYGIMHSERALLELVGLVYEAASDSAQWVPFRGRLSRILRTPLSALYVRDLADGHRSVTAEVGFDPAYLSSCKEYYANKNALMIHRKRHLWPGNVRPRFRDRPPNVHSS